MTSFAVLTLQHSDVAILSLVLAVVGCFACWRFVHWLLDGPISAEPWDQEVSTALDQDEATPVCCRCLQPHDPSADFCPECGAPVGTYTNLLPFPYLFSLGDLVRVGTTGAFHRTPVTIAGFVLLGLAEYTILAPFYWFMLLRNIRAHPSSLAPSLDSPKTDV
jgi:hypothetical protein